MALKAGYNGIKKNLLDKLLQMSGALIIKSLGTALSLSDAGELRVRNASDSHSGVVQPDGETTFIEGGLLKAASSGYTRDLLYGSDTITYPPAQVSEITLQKDGSPVSISDYDMLIVITGWLDTNVKCVQSWSLPCSVLMQTVTPTVDTDFIFALPNNAGASSGTGQWTRIGKGTSDSKLAIRYTKGNTVGTGIYQVIGIKF